MSSELNPDWVNKLKPFKGDTTKEEQTNIINTINKFRRYEIFNHNYNEYDIFHHIYKDNSNSQAKRQPNPFMIFRIVLGLVANRNKTKLGDGTLQSKIAGLMWGNAEPEEKNTFAEIGVKFKNLHKEKFPEYEYKPKARPQVTGFAENMTSRNFEPGVNISNHQQMTQETSMLAQTSKVQTLEDNNGDMWNDFSLLDQAIMLNGGFPQLIQPFYYPYSCQSPPVDQILTSQQIGQFNTSLPTLNGEDKYTWEKYNYSLQSSSTPSIASNCLDQSFDPNQANNYAFNFNSPFNY